MEQIDVIKRLIARYPMICSSQVQLKDILNAFENGKIASLIGVEGGHTINNSLAVLRTFYDSGVRYLTLTHNCNTAWAESALTFEKNSTIDEVEGLTDFGELVIGEMNRLGMLVDLSHTSDRTVNDALAVAAAPVIFSHSSARELCNSSRNVPDDILKKVKRNGGVVMVNFYPNFLTCSDNATIYDVIDHINHIRNVTGVDHVGLGSDFNGISKVPEGLEDVSKYPNLFAELLLDPSWTKDDLKKLAGLNFLRVFRLVESVKNVLNGEAPIENKMAEDMKK
ncbi:Dipeptidase 1 [Armadillidium nasatum]|uniref:Dipeptidase n=1 Tax=Armadillidium nasatum TaxID=96803 RepID=A0A5N5T931_9CRUS|nr:Dipeptidase 1 [Armadillidium nasatum]